MIPSGTTYAEVGMLLESIGRQMRMHAVCFGAVLEDGHSHVDIRSDLSCRMLQLGDFPEMTADQARQRAEELMRMTDIEIVGFVEGLA